MLLGQEDVNPNRTATKYSLAPSALTLFVKFSGKGMVKTFFGMTVCQSQPGEPRMWPNASHGQAGEEQRGRYATVLGR